MTPQASTRDKAIKKAKQIAREQTGADRIYLNAVHSTVRICKCGIEKPAIHIYGWLVKNGLKEYNVTVIICKTCKNNNQ